MKTVLVVDLAECQNKGCINGANVLSMKKNNNTTTPSNNNTNIQCTLMDCGKNPLLDVPTYTAPVGEDIYILTGTLYTLPHSLTLEMVSLRMYSQIHTPPDTREGQFTYVLKDTHSP